MNELPAATHSFTLLELSEFSLCSAISLLFSIYPSHLMSLLTSSTSIISLSWYLCYIYISLKSGFTIGFGSLILFSTAAANYEMSGFICLPVFLCPFICFGTKGCCKPSKFTDIRRTRCPVVLLTRRFPFFTFSSPLL